jgi:hypothetical protein
MAQGDYSETYWNGRGLHKAKYEAAQEQIPAQGRAATMELNLLRVVVNLYYTLYNDGSCNLEIKQPPVKFFLADFSSEIEKTGEASHGDVRRVMEMTEREADRLDQKLIDAFERVMNACILIAYNSLPPSQRLSEAQFNELQKAR